MSSQSPLVSIVITTKNEEKNIGRCLDSILKQSYPKNMIEVIVVDNNSSDRTKEIAKKFTNKVFNKRPERSVQRNFGIRRAKGKYILFIDADMSLSEKVIEECVNKFESYKVIKSRAHKEKPYHFKNFTNFRTSSLVGLYIPEIVSGNSFWCKGRNFERSFYNATVIDCVRFFPKRVWEKVEGFDENLTGPEDWDFDKKVRRQGKIDITRSPLYHNERDFSLGDYLKGKSYYLRSFDKYIKKWGRDDADMKKQLSFWYRFIGVFVEGGKWRKLIQHPFLTLGMYFLRILVGIRYICHV